jgi:RNA polymerase sigma-70 factor (ECF subfamily)
MALPGSGGDRQAFTGLVERYWMRIYRWLYGVTRSSHTAEDLTQEVFLRAWDGLPALREESCLRPWLFRIARNCLIDSLRKPRPEPLGIAAQTARSREPDPVTAAVEREGGALVAEACAELPVHYRTALLLWTQEEMSYAEMASVLGTTEETARWRVCKARQLLLKRLGPYLDGGKS